MLYSLDTTRDLGEGRQKKRGMGSRSLQTAGKGDILHVILNGVKNLIRHGLQILRLAPQNDTLF